MAISYIYGADLAIKGWFAPEATTAGWFDQDLTETGAAGPVTGTLAYTEAADTAALAGTATPPPISGTLGFTEGNDTAAIAASVGVSATLAASEGNDTAVLAGTFTPPLVTGTITYTEAADTAAVTGNVDGGTPTDNGTQNRGALLWSHRQRTVQQNRPQPQLLPLRVRLSVPPTIPTVTTNVRFTETNDGARIDGTFDDWWLIEAEDELLLLVT